MTKLRFLSKHIEVDVPSGSELLQIGRRHPELPLKFGCTRGDCGVCAVKVLLGQDNLTRQSKQEVQTLKNKHLDSTNYRLACQCAINGDVTLE